MNYPIRFWYQLLLSSLVLSGAGQLAQAQDPALTRLQQQVESHRTQVLDEKLFVQTDRPAYMTGEVMWFRLFYLDGALHRPLDVSKVAYLEIAG